MNLAAQYDNRSRVPDHPAIIAAWSEDAARFRSTCRPEADIAYGGRPRNRYDLFNGSAAGPIVVFIHGGYWRSFDKGMFSHMAAGAVGHGLAVAVPGYTLCPEVTVPDIVDELRQFVVHLWKRHRRPLVISGHSAGGHLAACLAATAWEAYGLPEDTIISGLAVSGLFDLRPLMATPHNADIRLTEAHCLVASPLLWRMPGRMPFDFWYGGLESAEFMRQSASLAAAWAGLGLACPLVEMAGANHFNAANPLADPESPLTRRLAQLAGA